MTSLETGAHLLMRVTSTPHCVTNNYGNNISIPIQLLHKVDSFIMISILEITILPTLRKMDGVGCYQCGLALVPDLPVHAHKKCMAEKWMQGRPGMKHHMILQVSPIMHDCFRRTLVCKLHAQIYYIIHTCICTRLFTSSRFAWLCTSQSTLGLSQRRCNSVTQ